MPPRSQDNPDPEACKPLPGKATECDRFPPVRTQAPGEPDPAKHDHTHSEQWNAMAKRFPKARDTNHSIADDPSVYSGRAGKGPSPFAIFVIATFWLGVIGGATMFFSILWGSVILGIAAITLICALLCAG